MLKTKITFLFDQRKHHFVKVRNYTPLPQKVETFRESVCGAIAVFYKNIRNRVPLISSDKGLTLALLCNYPQ